MLRMFNGEIEKGADMDTIERVKRWLEERGCDGLVCEGCSCSLDSLYECGEIREECRPAVEVSFS